MPEGARKGLLTLRTLRTLCYICMCPASRKSNTKSGCTNSGSARDYHNGILEKVVGSWILLLDSLNNKSSNAFSSYLLYKKYVSQNTSSEHVLHEPSVCT